MPLLYAIRSTASHVQNTSNSMADPPDGPKRVVKSALALGQPPVVDLMDESVAQGPLSGQVSASTSGQVLSAAASSMSVSGLGKRIATPHAPGTPRGVGVDSGTPLAERTTKKKKRGESSQVVSGTLNMKFWLTVSLLQLERRMSKLPSLLEMDEHPCRQCRPPTPPLDRQNSPDSAIGIIPLLRRHERPTSLSHN